MKIFSFDDYRFATPPTLIAPIAQRNALSRRRAECVTLAIYGAASRDTLPSSRLGPTVHRCGVTPSGIQPQSHRIENIQNTREVWFF